MDWLPYAMFAGCAAAMLYSGSRLTRLADGIAEATGLGRSWTGFLLLGAITSLPEASTGLSAVSVDLPNIAAGDIFGSLLFNLGLLALLDLHGPPSPILKALPAGMEQAALVLACLLGLVGLTVAGSEWVPGIGWISLVTPTLLLAYPFLTRLLRIRNPERHVSRKALRGTWGLFWFHAAIVLTAGTLLPGAAAQVADDTGLARTTMGTLFVAATTSMPELVVTLAAARARAWELAAGNLVGSNAFDLFLLGLDDVVYVQAPMLNSISMAHLVAIGAALVAHLAVFAGRRLPARRIVGLEWSSWIFLLCWLTAAAVLLAL